MNNHTRYQIDHWRVDFSSNTIVNNLTNQEVKLEAKTMAVLQYLTTHANQTVTRDQLLDAIWSDMVTVQDVLTNAIGKLRKALGDSERQLIVTVPKVGYRLNAAVSPVTPTEAKTGDNPARKNLSLAVAISLVIVLALIAILLAEKSPTTASRIAVMPMKNLGQPSTDYFSEGLADNIRTQLTLLPRLQVIAKTSVDNFAKDEKLSTIAEQLNIAYVVTGAVRKNADQVSINLQLTNLANHTLEWSDNFIGSHDDAFRFQQQVAQAIAKALTIKLDPPASITTASITTASTTAPTAKARQFFQLAQYYRYKRTTDDYLQSSFDVAIKYYHQAIAESPSYADAYAELARSWIVLAVWGYSPPQLAFKEAQIAVDKALALNPDLPLAHTVQGTIAFLYDWQWSTAQKHIRRALQIDPSNSNARQWLALLLSSMQRHDPAYEQMLAAENVDPLSSLIKVQKSYLQLLAGDIKAAATLGQAAIDFNPYFPGAHYLSGWVSQRQNDWARAEQQLALAEDSYLTKLRLAMVYAQQPDKQAQANTILNEALSLRKVGQTYISAYWLAAVYVALGEQSLALDWLERAVSEKAVWISRLAVDPDFDQLRGLPRFQRLLQALPFYDAN